MWTPSRPWLGELSFFKAEENIAEIALIHMHEVVGFSPGSDQHMPVRGSVTVPVVTLCHSGHSVPVVT